MMALVFETMLVHTDTWIEGLRDLLANIIAVKQGRKAHDAWSALRAGGG